jgi:hypothetical protein
MASGGNPGAYLGNNTGNPAGVSNPTAFYQAVDATGVSGDYQFSFDYTHHGRKLRFSHGST